MGFFNDVKGDMSNVKEEYLGPDYEYHKKIKTPDQLGMSGRGSLSALSSNIAGIVNYVGILITGANGNRASHVKHKPLGDKYFLKTDAECTDYRTNNLVPRSIYINNVPTGRIPLISELTEAKFDYFKGLAPGLLSDLYEINPAKMFRGFMAPSEPLCAEVKLEVVGNDDISYNKSAFVPIVELMDLQNAFMVPSGTVTNEMKEAMREEDSEYDTDFEEDKQQNSQETFMNMCDIINGRKKPKRRRKVKEYKDTDPLSNIYLISFTVLMVYLFAKLLKK